MTNANDSGRVQFIGALVAFVLALSILGLRMSGAIEDTIAVPGLVVFFAGAAALTAWGGLRTLSRRRATRNARPEAPTGR